MALAYAVPRMRFPWSPLSTIRTCSAGSCAVTTGSPASGGNAPGTPAPLAPWHDAHFAAYTRSPLAA